MKKIANTLLCLLLLVAVGCDTYDDTRVKEDLDVVGKRIEALESKEENK